MSPPSATPTEDKKPTPTPDPSPTPPPALATPHARQPAAGICGRAPEGEPAAVDIFPDIPSPRCIQVTGDQRLQVTNRTDTEITLRIGPYELDLPPGETAILDNPLGSFLAPGVHILGAAPFSGPEVWLE